MVVGDDHGCSATHSASLSSTTRTVFPLRGKTHLAYQIDSRDDYEYGVWQTVVLFNFDHFASETAPDSYLSGPISEVTAVTAPVSVAGSCLLPESLSKGVSGLI